MAISMLMGTGPSDMFSDVVTTMLHAHRERFGQVMMLVEEPSSGFSFLFALKCACVMIQLVQVLTPLQCVMKFHERGHTGEFDPLPFFMVFLSASTWCIYGAYTYFCVHISGGLVILLPNVVGVIFGAIYTSIYARNCHREDMMDRLRIYGTVGGLEIFFLMTVAHHFSSLRATFVLGLVAATLSIGGSASTLITARKVIETRSIESVPVTMACVMFISNMCWTCCGIMIHEHWVSIPAFVGLCFSSVQLTLCALYWPTTPRKASEALVPENFISKWVMTKGFWKKAASRPILDEPSYGSMEPADSVPKGSEAA